MPSYVLQLALFGSLLVLSQAAFRNCSEDKQGRTLTCFTCMGRDSENCEFGEVCCKGSCFKLVDEEHDIIVKGCTNDEEEDGSMKRRKLPVSLYFEEREQINGKSYFCNNGDYCNQAVHLSVLSSIGALFLLFLL